MDLYSSCFIVEKSASIVLFNS